MANERTVVVTGVAGSVGRAAAAHLVRRGWKVIGVDRKAAANLPPKVECHQADIRKRSFDDLLRKYRPWALLHLARISRFEVDPEERHRVNFEGAVRAFDAALAAGVTKIVLPSRHTVYGANPDQPQFVTEDHPPSAGRRFPEIQDLVAADLYACGLLWRKPEAEMVVLRPVNILGPTVNTLFSRYLTQRRVFQIAGFDPVYQVLHEADAAAAFEAALEPGLKGVFNVTGPGEAPLHVIIEESGPAAVHVPEPLVLMLRGRFGFANIPLGALDFLKYACTIDGRRFREATGFAPQYDLADTVRSISERRQLARTR